MEFIYLFVFIYECLPRIASSIPMNSVINEGPTFLANDLQMIYAIIRSLLEVLIILTTKNLTRG